jgi:hypothetical protein
MTRWVTCLVDSTLAKAANALLIAGSDQGAKTPGSPFLPASSSLEGHGLSFHGRRLADRDLECPWPLVTRKFHPRKALSKTELARASRPRSSAIARSDQGARERRRNHPSPHRRPRSPTSAADQRVRLHHARAQINCPQNVMILPGRGYGVCSGHFWFRAPRAGAMTTGPAFWRHLRLDWPDDHREEVGRGGRERRAAVEAWISRRPAARWNFSTAPGQGLRKGRAELARERRCNVHLRHEGAAPDGS